ncbi:MAG: gamma-glutamylcyclotransferase [bacterium]|nr:gamma-glutamylcyclotransferase [bacterium]
MKRETLKTLYFAYGSNLSAARLQARVLTAEPAGTARLEGHRLVCDKPGRDGSAKANLVTDPAGHVWGALYLLEARHLATLDRFEGGYERLVVSVESHVDGRAAGFRDALTYRSDLRTADPIPFDWYRQLILDGARDHGLPAAWLARLEALPCRLDPSRAEVR